ncbi:MAG TPA: oxidoreductase [Clostridiales bacterium UBA8960]|jgi:ferredoxin-NADP reductase|nr:oxidoreductase [Clostridiales bacterium UBA8960]
MNLFSDLFPIFKKYQVEFQESYKEIGDIHTFIFKSPELINWKAGQHGIFTVNHIKMKNATRPFSIASIPSEGHIKISMKIGEKPSDFKRALISLTPGMKVSMRGPIGSLYPTSQKPLLFIAGGIGITPYRALVKDLLSRPATMPNDVKLLYLSSQSEFIYKEEFESASMETPIKANYLVNRDQLSAEVEHFITLYKNDAEYFIVGPKPLTSSLETLLKNKGINKKMIKKDIFIGY